MQQINSCYDTTWTIVNCCLSFKQKRLHNLILSGFYKTLNKWKATYEVQAADSDWSCPSLQPNGHWGFQLKLSQAHLQELNKKRKKKVVG